MLPTLLATPEPRWQGAAVSLDNRLFSTPPYVKGTGIFKTKTLTFLSIYDSSQISQMCIKASIASLTPVLVQKKS